MIDLSIVIPVYNSEEILDELVSHIKKALGDTRHEIILVNDDSRDDSWRIIARLAGREKNVVGINLRRNCGQDNAIMAGMNHSSGEYVVIMDDDLQHSPYDIMALFNKCREGYDVCYANFVVKRQAAWKNMGSWVNGKIAEWLIDKPPGIYLSPFEIVHRDVVKEVLKYKGPYPYVQGLILRASRNCAQVDVKHHRRFKGKSNYNMISSMMVFMKLATGFSVVPLRVVTMIGFVTSSFGFFLSLYYLYVFFNGETIVEGWTTLVVLLLIIGGIILISLGLIGEYIGRIFMTMNTEPQYVIKEKIN